MRLRNVTGAKEQLAESIYIIHEPETRKGKWNTVFQNDNPIHIEIGMGKGKFLTTMAQQNPDINYIGIEKYASVLIRAVEKRSKLECANLTFLLLDAAEITNVFEQNEVARIYLNFSDPWPKDRHARRRLTSTEFFGRYDRILQKEGIVAFKTDNEQLFDFSLEQVTQAGWCLMEVTRDLHHIDNAEGNVMTEYEEKFSAMGNPIYRLEAYRA